MPLTRLRLHLPSTHFTATSIDDTTLVEMPLPFPLCTDALEKSQKAGEDGDVDASIMLAATADDLKLQHDRMVKQLTAPDRTMSVCDICGVFVNSTDNDQRRQVTANMVCTYMGGLTLGDRQGLGRRTGSCCALSPPRNAMQKCCSATPLHSMHSVSVTGKLCM